MLADANVTTVKLNCRLLSAQAEVTRGVSRVASINVLCEPEPVTATVFVDASYDGDVMVAVGDVEYTAGREANTTYNESLAGARVPGWAGVGGPRHVNALRPDGSIMKYVANVSELASPGSADDALMAFQHRMCVSGDADRIPWPAPPGYDPADFLLIQRALEANNGSANFFTSSEYCRADEEVAEPCRSTSSASDLPLSVATASSVHTLAVPPSSLPGYPGPKKKYCLCWWVGA
jgi:hypothetical protein